MNDAASLAQRALEEIASSADLATLDDVRVRWLGKKGLLTERLKSLGGLPAAERPAAGQRINEGLPLTQAVNLCGIDEFHQEMPGPVISRSSLR